MDKRIFEQACEQDIYDPKEWLQLSLVQFVDLTKLDTYLSKDISDLLYLAKADQSTDQKSLWFNEKECVLNYNFLSNTCIEINNSETIDFFKSIKNLGRFMQTIKQTLIENFDSSSHADLFFQNNDDLKLFNFSVVENLYFKNPYKSSYKTRSIESIQIAYLVLFSLFERSFGDILYSINGYNTAQVPFLLKDLVSDIGFEQVFDKQMINLIKLLVYSPNSLNLRNLIWHGFLNPTDHETYEEYLYLLIAIISTLNFKLKDKSKLLGDIQLKTRNKFNLSYSFNTIDTNNLELFKNFDLNFNECLFIINNSKLIDECRKGLWIRAFSNNDVSNLHNYNYVSLLLCQLEHILRKLYTIANNTTKIFDLDNKKLILEFKVDTSFQLALTTNYYLTIDDLIDSTKSKQSKNYLIDLLDADLLMILYDLLKFADGPRLRDHLSHGELSYYEVDIYYLKILKFVCLKLASLSLNDDSNIKNLLRFSDQVRAGYSSNFHPIDCLKRDLFEFIKFNFSISNQVELDEETKISNTLLSNLLKDLFNFEITKEQKIRKLKAMWKINANNFLKQIIFRYDIVSYKSLGEKDGEDELQIKLKLFKSNELQFINLIRSLLKEIHLFAQNLKNKIKLVNESSNSSDLRQRQRKNFDIFNSLTNYFQVFLSQTETFLILLVNFFVIKLTLDFASLDSQSESKLIESVHSVYFSDQNQINVSLKKDYKKISLIINSLKLYLKLMQNLNKNVIANKWLESKRLIMDFNRKMLVNDIFN